MIYVLSIGPGKLIKIGYTGKPIVERVAQLQTGCPFQITPLFTVEGNLYQEKEIHKGLRRMLQRRDLDLPGEWYPSKPEIMKNFLHYLKLGCDMGLAYLDDDEYRLLRVARPAEQGLSRRQKENLKVARQAQKTQLQTARTERKRAR